MTGIKDKAGGCIGKMTQHFINGADIFITQLFLLIF